VPIEIQKPITNVNNEINKEKYFTLLLGYTIKVQLHYTI
jgi:hypothetical protein